MRRQSISTLLLLATVWAVPGFYGCTVAGFIVGAGIDRSMTDTDTLHISQFFALKQGDDVVVTLRNGKVYSGPFVKLDTLTAAEYANNYDACRLGNHGEAELPVLGDSITLSRKGEKNEVLQGKGGALVGFDGNLIQLRREGKPVVITNHAFETLKDSHGHIIDQNTFRRLMEEGDIPLMTAIVLKTTNGNERLLMERINRMEVSSSKNNTLIFVGLGLAADIVGIWLISSNGLFPFWR